MRVRGAGAGQTQGKGTGKGEEDWGSHISVATKGACEVGVVEVPFISCHGEHHQRLQAREAERPCVEQV